MCVCVCVCVCWCWCWCVTLTSSSPLLSPCVRSKRRPCAHSKRPRVYRQHARKCYHMQAWCRHIRGRFECTHGGFQRATPHHRTHHTDHTPHHNTRHNNTRRQRQTGTDRDRERQRETESDRRREKERHDKKAREDERGETREEKRREEKRREEKRREEKRREEKRREEKRREEKRREEKRKDKSCQCWASCVSPSGVPAGVGHARWRSACSSSTSSTWATYWTRPSTVRSRRCRAIAASLCLSLLGHVMSTTTNQQQCIRKRPAVCLTRSTCWCMAWRLLRTTHLWTRTGGFRKEGRMHALRAQECPITSQSTGCGTTRTFDDFASHNSRAGVQARKMAATSNKPPSQR